MTGATATTRPRTKLGVIVTVLGLMLGLLPLARAEEGTARAVPVPETEFVPADAGIRGGPWGFTTGDPMPEYGYVEEEYFIAGMAKSYGVTPAPDASYKTRLYILRPADMGTFNGTVVVEWLNVSGGYDTAAMWSAGRGEITREGEVFVGVSAQKVGIDGQGFALGGNHYALKNFDPVRYESLHHPGDDYSWDIFSQAGMALLAGNPRPLGDATIERMFAAGQSQSGSRMREYLVRNVHAEALRATDSARRVYDGVMPMSNAVGQSGIPTDQGPVLWVNEVQSGFSQPDGGDFRLIEMASGPHASWTAVYTSASANNRNSLRAVNGPSGFNKEDASQYGENGSGPCPRGFYPDRYVYATSIHLMDQWLRTGDAPKSYPRIERSTDGAALNDDHGNTRGGFRLPVVDVPIATYGLCALFGSTVKFDPVKLATLYPTHADYVAKMTASINESIADGRLQPADGAELLARAQASSIGGDMPTQGAP